MSQKIYAATPAFWNPIRIIFETKADKSDLPKEDVKDISDGTVLTYEPPFDKIKNAGESHTDTWMIHFKDEEDCDQGEMKFVTTNASANGGSKIYTTKIKYNGTKLMDINSSDPTAFTFTETKELDCNFEVDIEPTYTNAPKYQIKLTFKKAV